jgi:hypothetical protein
MNIPSKSIFQLGISGYIVNFPGRKWLGEKTTIGHRHFPRKWWVKPPTCMTCDKYAHLGTNFLTA